MSNDEITGCCNRAVKVAMSILCKKTRTCLLVLTCLMGIVCLIFLYAVAGRDDASSWTTIVSQTQQHLRDLKENPHRHRATETDVYLRKLGVEPDDFNGDNFDLNFDSNEISSFSSSSSSSDVAPSAAYFRKFTNFTNIQPLIAVPVQSGQINAAWNLYASIRMYAPADWHVYFYDLDLSYHERQELTIRCKNASINSRTPTCQLRRMDWSTFPGHISQWKYEAYRPVIIQDALNITGAVFYVTPTQRLRDAVPQETLKTARRLGVVGWRLDDDSTSAITHPKSFAFFHTDAQHYYFHHTIRGDRLLIFNTDAVRKQFMFPWLQCALTLRCVSPLGAQDTGCRLYRKPLYLYSGCHHYDVSVLNVVLGLMFKFDSTPYTVSNEEGNFVGVAADI